jgi:glycerol dehydrogenase
MQTKTIFPSRYVQGAGALGLLGEEAARYGSSALLLLSPSAAANYGPVVRQSLSGLSVTEATFSRECCDQEIDRLKALATVDLVIGMGGGKTLDTAKAVADDLGLPVVIVPTLASSDAPCSALSVIYTPEGEFLRYHVTKSNPNVVLVDSTVIAEAPVRFLVAGMGDALATWFEADSCSRTQSANMSGYRGSITALGLARSCYETLLRYGPLALRSCEAHAVTPALDRVIEANVLLSGLGFESGGLAAAHAIHNGLTVLEPTHEYWHGEKVAIGTLASLFLTDKGDDVIEEVYSFCEAVGLPTTFEGIGLRDVSTADLRRVAEAAVVEGETIHNEAGKVTASDVLGALIAADAVGRARLVRTAR